MVDRLSAESSLVVALSGGVDSAVLLAVAAEALGTNRVLAMTGRSASIAAEELEDARLVAAFVGVRWEAIDTSEMSRPGYLANDGMRCFHCRSELFDRLFEVVAARGIGRVAYGAILDDLGDDRPGMRAATERGVLAPLLDAGITKEDVRLLAAEYELPVRDKPAAACLSSRIPVGTAITEASLAQVSKAERAVRELGFVQFRVRHHGEFARVELDPSGLQLIEDPRWKARLESAVRAAGFRRVTIDPEGYRPAGTQTPRLYSIDPQRSSGQ